MTDVSNLAHCPLCGPKKNEDEQISVRSHNDLKHDYTIGYEIFCPCCGISVFDEYLEDLVERWDARPQGVTPEVMQERIARAWAGIDGHEKAFDQGKAGSDENGRFEGYMAEAEELMRRAGITDTMARIEKLEASLRPFSDISAEGVVKQESGHVTITTCAEYFHQAAEALKNSQ